MTNRLARVSKNEMSKVTVNRRVKAVENKIRKEQLDLISRQIDDIDYDRSLDDDLEATIRLEALKHLKKSQLASWRQFRTRNGWSNEALVGA